MKKTVLTAVSILFCTMTFAQPKLREDNIEEILGAMTLKEKARLLVGSGWGSMLGLSILSSEDVKVPGAAGTTHAVPRLGIPSITLADGPAGLRIAPTRKHDKNTYYCTGFPVGTLLACTWDTELVEEVGKAMGNEVLEYGVDVILGPGMNLMRNPLCGRNFEYYSEDPLLCGKTAAAMIRGIQSNGVGTSAKHFAANNQETNRLANDSRVDEETLRSLYLKGFEIAVKEAQPWTIMSSYNKLNGEFTQESHWLLTEVLRDEWGFEGLVMSDWTNQRNTKAQVAAGNDLMEPGMKVQVKDIIKAVKKGELSEEQVDVCVRRVLQLVVKTPAFKGYKYSNAPDLKAHAAVSRRAATEGMVLLENNGVLPVKSSNVALYGVGSYDMIAGGTGSGNVNKPYVVNFQQGLENAGFNVDAEIAAQYKSYISDKGNRKKGFVLLGDAAWIERPVSRKEIEARASENDFAILTIFRQAGEGEDRVIEDDFNLSKTETQILNDLCEVYHSLGKKVVVVLNVGGVVETASWKKLPDAVLLAWAPGQECGNAVVDVLTGVVNPSGRLAMTFPNSYGDIPSAANFPIGVKTGATSTVESMTLDMKADKSGKDIDYTDYAERSNVGYRYFGISGENVSYPFGYGLSYTSFEETALGDGRVKVTNTGSVAGKHVVMHYAQDGTLDAFAKTRLLAPGESQIISYL